PCQVDADAVAPDAVERLRCRDVAAAALEGDNQLDLVMHVLRERRIGRGAAVRDDRVGGLGEEERRLALVLAHLLDVLEIVAPHAPDAAHRKFFVAAGDGEGGLRRGRNDVLVVAHDAGCIRSFVGKDGGHVFCRGGHNTWELHVKARRGGSRMRTILAIELGAMGLAGSSSSVSRDRAAMMGVVAGAGAGAFAGAAVTGTATGTGVGAAVGGVTGGVPASAR